MVIEIFDSLHPVNPVHPVCSSCLISIFFVGGVIPTEVGIQAFCVVLTGSQARHSIVEGVHSPCMTDLA